MSKKQRIIAVIPARGGSKGIPHKNIQILCGKPLIEYSIKAALASRVFDDVVVSTDDRRIRDIAIKAGALCPFLRPASLSGDCVATYPVIKHAVEWMERCRGAAYDLVTVLQPTAPLRSAGDIRKAIAWLQRSRAASLVSVALIDDPHPCKVQRVIKGKLYNFIDRSPGVRLARRQDLEPAYALNGAIYLSRRAVLDKALLDKDVLAYIMPAERSVNIDTRLDLEFAGFLMSKKRR
ncbi:MAG TPA: acylneuraminate cytidylyltransferase family protein [Candidatus Omnitrophota bacterium]|nr:acylneuraminate cytidylyltransferase family protein [Candidatus Omnitrophota bacterium]HRZ15290.1 acylneuraminate cytidylyltransferase family protein [Candidatus Omnitrophota bacterium]